MKKSYIMILLVLSFTIFVNADEILKPETQIILKQGDDYVRQIDGKQLWQEYNNYESDQAITSKVETNRVDGEEVVTISMPYTVQNSLAEQKAKFEASTRNYVAKEYVPTNRGTHRMSTSYYKMWGNKSRFAAYVDAKAEIAGSGDARNFHAHLNAGGYVFDYHAKAVEFNADMQNCEGGSTASTSLKVFGKTYFSSSQKFVYKTLFFNGEIGKTVRFFIGPVPLSVRGAVGGSAGFTAGLSLVERGVKGSATPSIDTYGKADAGVDLWLVKAGVEGQIKLLKDRLPISLTTELLTDNKTLSLSLDVTNYLEALAGKINIFAKVAKLWGGWKTYSTTLFSWSGLNYTWVLYRNSYQVKLY